MNTPRFGMWQAPFLSFFSRAFYQDVGQNWRGIGFLYLVLLVSLSWVPTWMVVRTSMDQFLRAEAPKILDQLPEIRFHDGLVSLPETVAQPHPIVLPRDWVPEEKEPITLAVIDTREDAPPFDEVAALMYLTRHRLYLEKPGQETRIKELGQLKGSFVIDRKVIDQLLGWSGVVFGVSILAATCFSILWRLVQIQLYALLGLALARAFQADLGYGALMRLATMAITPALITATALDSTGWVAPGFLLSVAVTVVYMIFAVRMNANREFEKVLPEPMMPAPEPPESRS